MAWLNNIISTRLTRANRGSGAAFPPSRSAASAAGVPWQASPMRSPDHLLLNRAHLLGQPASRNSSPNPPKNVTDSHSTVRDISAATCHTSALMNKKVTASSNSGRARVSNGISSPSEPNVRRAAHRNMVPMRRNLPGETTQHHHEDRHAGQGTGRAVIDGSAQSGTRHRSPVPLMSISTPRMRQLEQPTPRRLRRDRRRSTEPSGLSNQSSICSVPLRAPHLSQSPAGRRRRRRRTAVGKLSSASGVATPIGNAGAAGKHDPQLDRASSAPMQRWMP